MAELAAGGLTFEFKANVADLKRGLTEIKQQLSSVAVQTQATAAKMSAVLDAAAQEIQRNATKKLGAAGTDGGKAIVRGLKANRSSYSDAGSSIGFIIGASITAAAAGAIKSGSFANDLANQGQDTRLSTSLIQSLNYAGAGKGISTDEVKGALEAFSEVSKKAKDDAQDFYKALDNIGPKFSKAFEAAPTQEARLRTVADALASTTDEVKKAQLAQEAFGTDNERLTSLLGSGTRAFDAYKASAKNAGITLSDELTKNQAEANRILQQAVQVIGSDLRNALANLIPVLTEAAGWAAILAKSIGDISASKGLGNVKLYTDHQLWLRADELQKQGGDAAAGGEMGTIKSEMLRRAMSGGATNSAAFTFENGRFTSLSSAAQGTDQKGDPPNQPPAFKPRPSLSSSDSGGKLGLDQIQRYLEQLRQQKRDEEIILQTEGKSVEEKSRLLALSKLETLEKRTGREATEKEKSDIQDQAVAVAKLREQYEQITKTKEAWAELGNTFAQALDGWIVRGEKFKDVIKSLVQQLASSALQGLLTGNGAFGSLFGTAAKGDSKIGGLFGSIFGGFRAGGGGVDAGKTYVVGERGPELFRPSGSGSIVSNSALGGGTSVNVVMQNDFRGVDPSMRAFMLTQLAVVKQEAIAAAVRAVPAARSRDPGYLTG